MQLVEAGGIELERPGAGQGVARQHRVGLPRYTELASKTQNFYPAFAWRLLYICFASRCAKDIALKNAKKIANEIYIGNLHWKFALEIALEICIGNLHWKFALGIALEICIGNCIGNLHW